MTKIQPNGWWPQDRVATPAQFHRAGYAVARFTGHSYSPSQGFTLNPKPRDTGQLWDPVASRWRDASTGQFAAKRRNKVHRHPPKGQRR